MVDTQVLGSCAVRRTSSSLVFRTTIYAGIAQLVEHSTDNRKVTGSSPVICTNMGR